MVLTLGLLERGSQVVFHRVSWASLAEVSISESEDALLVFQIQVQAWKVIHIFLSLLAIV